MKRQVARFQDSRAVNIGYAWVSTEEQELGTFGSERKAERLRPDIYQERKLWLEKSNHDDKGYFNSTHRLQLPK